MINNDRFCEYCIHSGLCMHEEEMRKIRYDALKFVNNDTVEVKFSCKRFYNKGVPSTDMNWMNTVRGTATDMCCSAFPYTSMHPIKEKKGEKK